MQPLKIVGFALLLVCAHPSLSRELVPHEILSQRSGKSGGEVSQAIDDFRAIDPRSTIHVTIDRPATPDDFMAAESFYKAFKKNYPNALFTPSQDGISVGDYVVFFFFFSVTDSYDRDVQDYRTEATGIDCEQQYDGRVRCRESGRRRVASGSRTVTLTAAVHGVSSSTYRVNSAGRLEPLRSANSTIGLTGDDNCRNIGNVYSSLAYILGTQRFSSRPEKITYRAYPNQIGCYDRDDIDLR